jgi:hypothetical protein
MSALESKWAMFRAALAAQSAGETHITAKRIVASLLRANMVREFCARAQIDSARVLDAVGDEFDSTEHQAPIEYRPVEPLVKGVLDKVIEQHGHIGVSPLELLLDLMRADPALAERLAPHGLNAAAISAELGKP